MRQKPTWATLACLLTMTGSVAADQVIPDDLIVQGSVCVGFDCVNNESFGFDTIRLKENNLRIKFEDTSVGSFPSNDWQITINDSSSGGANYFAIDDVTGALTPFRIMAGAPDHALFVANSGRVGLGTNAPELPLHVMSGSSPALRLDQDGSGGFAPRAWDIGGNDSGFFIRDQTGGGNLPFRVRSGAPTSSIDIAANGDVGIGTAAPTATLHVYDNQGNARVRIEEASASAGARTLLELSNNGGVVARYSVAPDTAWETRAEAATWTIAKADNVGPGQFVLDAAGNLSITGTLSQGSSRALKTDIKAVDRDSLLDKAVALPLYVWRYKTSKPNVRHMGPMAEEFHDLFATGGDRASLAPSDLAGVALGAMQALAAKVEDRDLRIDAIQRRIDAIEARLAGAR